MPIAPLLRRELYNTPAWREQRQRVLKRAGQRCECKMHCGCFHVGGRCHSKERLQVAHVDHTSGARVDDDKLAAFCSACHLRYDEQQHIAERRRRRRRQLELLGQRSLV
jgi:hypothetical protein